MGAFDPPKCAWAAASGAAGVRRRGRQSAAWTQWGSAAQGRATPAQLSAKRSAPGGAAPHPGENATRVRPRGSARHGAGALRGGARQSRRSREARIVVCTVAIVVPVCTGPSRGPGSGRQRQAAPRQQLTAGCRQPNLESGRFPDSSLNQVFIEKHKGIIGSSLESGNRPVTMPEAYRVGGCSCRELPAVGLKASWEM